MTCANWILTIFAAIIFVLTMWPTILGTTSVWVVAILSILIIIVAWSMVECRICKTKKQK